MRRVVFFLFFVGVGAVIGAAMHEPATTWSPTTTMDNAYGQSWVWRKCRRCGTGWWVNEDEPSSYICPGC